MLLGSVALGVMFTSVSAIATNEWANYGSVDSKPHTPSRSHVPRIPYGYSTYQGYADPYGTPLPPQQYPLYPPQRAYPNQRPHRAYPHQNFPHQSYPKQNGISIIYQQSFPQETHYSSEQRGFVHGDANSRIEHSRYTLISDWRRYHLPDPAVGMHWIYQNGRYLQIPNDR